MGFDGSTRDYSIVLDEERLGSLCKVVCIGHIDYKALVSLYENVEAIQAIIIYSPHCYV